jgi:phosphocarrier protein
MLTRTVPVKNALGIHARAAARFVHIAGGFLSRVSVTCGARTVDGKSILGILLLAAARGIPVTISADGSDEVEALDALCRLVDSGFGEEPCSD